MVSLYNTSGAFYENNLYYLFLKAFQLLAKLKLRFETASDESY